MAVPLSFFLCWSNGFQSMVILQRTMMTTSAPTHISSSNTSGDGYAQLGFIEEVFASIS
jgi:hypothetical protein